nr:hypothetical protein [Tanacetum cinerariifolium]
MQQFWYTIKKVQGTDSYEFLLANKKCIVNAEVFRTVLDICPRAEDITYQIDHSKEKRSRSKNMSLKFVRIGEDYQEYGLSIPDVMLTDAIKQSKPYQMLIKYFTHQIPPKKSKRKESQGKKTVDTSIEEVDVSEEYEPEPAKKRTASKRRVKKKVTIYVEDNIISNYPNTALELGKSISQTKVEGAEAAKKVHATYAKIMTEPVPEFASRRNSRKETSDSPKKLKGVPSLTLAEQEVVDITQALKESKKCSRRKLGTGCSNEGTSSIPGVLDESTVISSTSSERTGVKPGVPDEEKNITERSDKQDAEDEDEEAELDENDIYKYKIRVRTDEFEVAESKKCEEEITDAANTVAKKKEVEKKVPMSVIPETTNLSPSPKNLTKTLVFTAVSSPIVTHIISTVQQTTTQILTPPIATDAPTITTAVSGSNALIDVLESRVLAVVDSYLDSKVGDVFQKEMQKHTAYLKYKYSLQHLPELTTKLIPTVDLEKESEKSPSKNLQIKKEHAEKQQMPKFTIKSIDKATLREYDLKSDLYQSMNANKSFNINPANYRLYHKLMEAFVEDENAMDKGVANMVQDHKRKRDDDDDDDDDEGPLVGPNQGKQAKRIRTKGSESSMKPSTTKETPKGKPPYKGSKTGKSASAQELVEEPITELVMDDASVKVGSLMSRIKYWDEIINKLLHRLSKWKMKTLSIGGRIYALELSKNIYVASKMTHPIMRFSLRRCPKGDHNLKEIASKTRWVKVVPNKVNILAWRVKLDNLPVRFNLSLRDFKEEILDAEVQANEAISLSDEEIALDAASSEGSMSGPSSEGEEAEELAHANNGATTNTSRSYQLVRHGGGGDQGSLLPRSMRLDLPKFNGADLESWMFAINEYFAHLATPDEHRLKVVGFNLKGDAIEWFRWMTRNNLVTSWDGFLDSVRNRFGSSKYEDPQGVLSKLLQPGTVTQYQDQVLAFVTATKTTASVVTQKQATPRVKVTQLDMGKPPLLSIPTQTNATAKPLAIKWVRGHKCPRKFLLLMADDEDDTGQEPVADVVEAVESGDISILNSLVMAAFMALSQPVLGLLDDLRKENKSLKELKGLHQKLESGDGPLRFRSASKVAAIEDLLVGRDELLRQLKSYLLAARERMKLKVNKRRRGIEFKVSTVDIAK